MLHLNKQNTRECRFDYPNGIAATQTSFKMKIVCKKCFPDDKFMIYDKNDLGDRDLGRPTGFWGPGGRVAISFKILKSHIGFAI